MRRTRSAGGRSQERGWTSKVQLEAMDIEGIDVAVIYPVARPLRPGHSRHGAAARRRHGARVQRLALRVLPGEPRAPARRRDDLAVRRRRRGGGDTPLRPGSRLPQRVPAAERGERPELARSLLRAPVDRARGAGSAAGIPRGLRLAAAASRRAVRGQRDAEARVLPPGRADARRGQLLRWAASSSAIRSCAWPFSRATAAGCRSCSGAWTSTGSGRATSTPRSSRWRRARTSSGSASCRSNATRSRSSTSSMRSATTGWSSPPTSRTGTRSSRARCESFLQLPISEAEQAQDPLGQLRRLLRPAGLVWRPSEKPGGGWALIIALARRLDQPEEVCHATDKLISADSHIVEPPDLYTSRIEPRFRDRAPRMERIGDAHRPQVRRLVPRRRSRSARWAP